MAVTLKQIAHASGVSFPTVSHVLNPASPRHHFYRAETRERVTRVARELGYRPNQAAQSMVTGRFGSVALLTTTADSRSYLPEELLSGIQQAVAERDLSLVLARMPDERLTSEQVMPKILRQTMTDGLLIDYTDHVPQAMRDLIDRHDIPSIWMNTKQPFDSICPDDAAAARMATSRLIELGHRRIAYADFAYADELGDEHYSLTDRRAGYAAAMREAGLEPRFLTGSLTNKDSLLLEEAHAVLGRPDVPTAIVAYSGFTLSPLLVAGLMRGLSVPRDLSLITFSDRKYDVAGIDVTTVLLGREELGASAVDMLEQKIANPRAPLPARSVGGHWNRGATVTSPRELAL